MRTLYGGILLCLCLSVTGCATPSGAVNPVTCQHPQVDPRSNAGLAQGLLDYHAALELCNSLNGVSE